MFRTKSREILLKYGGIESCYFYCSICRNVNNSAPQRTQAMKNDQQEFRPFLFSLFRCCEVKSSRFWIGKKKTFLMLIGTSQRAQTNIRNKVLISNDFFFRSLTVCTRFRFCTEKIQRKSDEIFLMTSLFF